MDLNFSIKITSPKGYSNVKRANNDLEKTTHTECSSKGDHHLSWLEHFYIHYAVGKIIPELQDSKMRGTRSVVASEGEPESQAIQNVMIVEIFPGRFIRERLYIYDISPTHK